MVRTVYDNLKPGQLFVASILNAQQPLVNHLSIFMGEYTA